MITKNIYIEYRENGTLASAFSVKLQSEDGTYGVRNLATGEIWIASGEVVAEESTGVYEITREFEENQIYIVSWQITPNSSDPPRYVLQTVGPFEDQGGIRAVSSFRGEFIQGTRSTLFLKITDMLGNARDASSINFVVADSISIVAQTGIPEKIESGTFVFDWLIPEDQTIGDYTVTWTYIVDGETRIEVQKITVSASTGEVMPGTSYDPRVIEFRMSLALMIRAAQNIPVYNEPAQPSIDDRTFQFSFARWNQSARCKIYRNNVIVTKGITIDYFRGEVTFDVPLLPQDRVKASYNFKWFRDDELDRFLSNSLHVLNYYPAVSRYELTNLEQRYIPLVLWGAAVDAIRHLMLDITFQEPALVFGSPEMQDKAFSRFEALKKNYEESWEKGLDQKKNRNYVGLTRAIVTPEFAMPGGRSRWFRYLFSGGGG